MVSLQDLNLYAAIFHYVLAVAFSSYFLYINGKYTNTPVQGVELSLRDHTITIFKQNHCDTNLGPCDSSGNQITAQWNSEQYSNVDIKVLQGALISFFLITGSFHLFYYLSGKNEDGIYNKVIENRNNYFRWIEYSITSTLMLYIIALTSGVKETNIYMTLFSINVSMIYTGQLVEVAARDGGDWKTPMILGFVLLLSEFSVIARSFWQRLSQVNSYLESNITDPLTKGQTIPSWLNAMIIILFLFFSCFGFISLYGAYNNTPYESIEKWYLIASFGAKATLGVFISYGLGQRVQGWRNN
jgi:hypothetical protein